MLVVAGSSSGLVSVVVVLTAVSYDVVVKVAWLVEVGWWLLVCIIWFCCVRLVFWLVFCCVLPAADHHVTSLAAAVENERILPMVVQHRCRQLRRERPRPVFKSVHPNGAVPAR